MTATADDNQAKSKEELFNAFKKIDIDGSGQISKEELHDNLRGQGLDVSVKDCGVVFDIIDKDKSGSINFNEYSLFMEQVQKMNMGKRKRRSIMKGTRASFSTPKPDMKKNKQGSKRHSLFDTRRMKSFRGKNINFDESLKKGETTSSDRSTKIRFFDVEVREYEITASDNPGVKKGVALELSWNYHILEHEHLDTFEAHRSKERSKNFMKEKKLSKHEREKILHEFGASDKEIQEAAKRAATIRNKRKKSIEMQQHDKLYENVEGKVRGIKKLFGLGKSKPVTASETVDLERLHPTLLAMMGGDDVGASQSSNIGNTQ